MDESESEEPLDLFSASTKPGQRITDKPELPAKGIVMRLQAHAETIEGEAHLKVGTARGFTIYSDEPAQIGGTETYPPPMAYIALGISFCLVTQIVRYATMMKIAVRSAHCTTDLHYSIGGSVLAGTVHTTWHGVRTRLELDSDETPERITALVRNAKGGCTAENLVIQAVPLQSEIVLNGSPIPEISGP